MLLYIDPNLEFEEFYNYKKTKDLWFKSWCKFWKPKKILMIIEKNLLMNYSKSQVPLKLILNLIF